MFSESLKRLRKARHITQERLAIDLGLAKSTISMYENGKREPDFETLESIADYFNVNMDVLTGREEPKSKSKSFFLSDHEKELVIAYRNNVALQPAVDRILCIESENTVASDMESSLKKYGIGSKKVSSSTK